MYRYPDAVIMVFCKAPIPGQVKTRLSPPLSPEQAVQLHCELTERTLQTATQNNLATVQLWCVPDIDHPYFIELEHAYCVERYRQQGKDLGERMRHAFAEALAIYDAAVLIGCDCPSLTSDNIDEALDGLTSNQTCVIAPAEDGGYVLIGLRQPHAYLFANMPWGTDKVLEISVARLQADNVNYKLLKAQWDVDTEADLKRYQVEMLTKNLA